MPLIQLRVTCTRAAGDEINIGLAFDGDVPTNEELTNYTNNFAWGLLGVGSQNAVPTIQLTPVMTEAFPAAGGPALAVGVADEPVPFGASSGGVQEVAICASLHVDTPRGPSPRGRIYWGPIAPSFLDQQRPAGSVQTTIRDMTLNTLQGIANGLGTPVVISRQQGGNERPAPVGLPIVGVSTDNAWDSQRRRGLDPTARVLEPFPVEE